MIERKAKFFILIIFLFLTMLVGCSSGIPQTQYQGIADELSEAQAKNATLQADFQGLQAQKEALTAEVQAARAKNAELEKQVSGLKDQYELSEGTPAEIAEKIVRYYHETHVYSTYDLFVCSDMASEVWNMLKAQGINSIIAIGSKDKAVTDILESDHAWVLAEVSPGEYLALEATAGFTVPGSQNPLYYRGWSFDSPAKLKAHNQLVNEYNVRIRIHNEIVSEASQVRDEYNRATDQRTADIKEAVYHKLTDLIKEQESVLNSLKSEIDGLATPLQ